jgi:hypothetical protein
MSGSLSIEAFNTLDHFFSGLIPEVELDDTGVSGSFVWVCSYGGMNFFRRMTILELFDAQLQKTSKLN